jgi:hypothetical protein
MRHTDIPTGSTPFSPWGDYLTSGQNLILRERVKCLWPGEGVLCVFCFDDMFYRRDGKLGGEDGREYGQDSC